MIGNVSFKGSGVLTGYSSEIEQAKAVVEKAATGKPFYWQHVPKGTFVATDNEATVIKDIFFKQGGIARLKIVHDATELPIMRILKASEIIEAGKKGPSQVLALLSRVVKY